MTTALPPKRPLDRFFQLSERQTTVGTELRAALVTFLTMSYILAVNPQILGDTGMPRSDVVAATALSAAIGCVLMGLLTNRPFALAAGMGMNAYFAYGVVGGSIDWRQALTAVFVAGLLFIALTVTGVRGALVRSVPETIKRATVGGIGLLLTLVGLRSAGLVVDDPATLVGLGDLSQPTPQLALAGLVIAGALSMLRVRGALLVAMTVISLAAWLSGVAPLPESWLAAPSLPRETFLAFDLSALAREALLPAILAFLFVDLFDTAGTLLGVGRLAGALDQRGDLPEANRAFLADAIATTAGAALGTSPVTTYIESATGIQEGGRTGLTAIAVGVLFVLALPLAPLLIAIPPAATAPVLVVVGALMMRALQGIAWSDIGEALPALLTVALMPFTSSIANGIAAGVLSWVGLRALTWRWRETSPLMIVLALLLVAFYAFGQPP